MVGLLPRGSFAGRGRLPMKAIKQFKATMIAASLVLALTQQSTTAQAQGQYEYERRLGNLFVKGWIENQESVFCGWANKEVYAGPGYISLYEHAYWLNGIPYRSVDFDVKTDYRDGTNVLIEILLDGKLEDKYPEEVTVSQGIAGSSSDLCDDGLPGLCPDKKSANVMRVLVSHLDRARALSFRIMDGQKIEQ